MQSCIFHKPSIAPESQMPLSIISAWKNGYSKMQLSLVDKSANQIFKLFIKNYLFPSSRLARSLHFVTLGSRLKGREPN
jgi:hypothetical protein